MLFRKKWANRDLNPELTDYESATLTIELLAHILIIYLLLFLNMKRKLLEFIGKDKWGSNWYFLDVKNDIFIHFTTQKRALEIIGTGKLLLDSPYGGMGAYATFAVSAIYGSYLPTVLNHIDKWSLKENSEVVGVEFKTNTVPKIGHIEEVSFGEKDVNLINPKIISEERAINILKNTPETIKENDYVIYDKNIIPQIGIVSQDVVKKANRVLKAYLKSSR